MAGEWLKFDCSLPEKPEVLAITVAMGWDDPDMTVGKLMRLFRWFDQHTVDGNAAGVTPALLDRIIGVTGFVQCVADVGWLVIGQGVLSLHNFDRHNGATAKGRAQTAKRVANHKANAKGNAETVSNALPREEKRREDTSSIEDVQRATPGEACKAMKAAGMQSVNPSDPRLVTLLNDGMTIEELVAAAGEAVERGKPFAYALATAEGRRQDAAARRPLPANAKGRAEPITFAEQERRAGMQRWEEMTGQRHPGLEKLREAGEVIDALPKTAAPRIEHVAAH